ncbi:putative diguanylate cyclase YdaM [Clostridium liquoris]|uniref:Putative diguanylate cyclase YdaM n=1 Tax=Clostridium liquoris TaxID=1289519 RepID=A0A2T0BAC7_9CLOT|nr:sensor domain-containing diguanylate cyclase [Clostridium liquoris]PRR80851.1 putative diguanylate cyclase YdaM [Clostridium liquoris]
MGKELLIFLLILSIGMIFIQLIRIKKMKKYIKTIKKIRETLYDVSYTISNTDNEEEIYSRILNVSINLIPYASKGSILILEDNNRFYYKTLVGYPKVLQDISLTKEELFINNIKSKGSIIIKNPSKFDENFLSKEKNNKLIKNNALDISCTISSPLYIDNSLIGLLNIDSTSYNKTFTEEDRMFMDYIKNELELVLKNSLTQKKLRYMANYDELTGLINRRRFKDIFYSGVDIVKNQGTMLSVVAIDINNFKFINDTYGHNVGDSVLKAFAEVLKNNISKEHICARIAGDEFIILLKNYSLEESRNKMEEIRDTLSDLNLHNTNLDFSYGVYCVTDRNNISPDDILIKVDRQMYKYKKIWHCNV